MTKHLRFLFVMLLAMIWSAGWAQTTIWSEDWSGVKKQQTPSAYNSAIYSQSNDGTQIYVNDKAYAGGQLPELLLKGKSTWTVKIKDLKGCSGTFKLEYKSNKSLTVTANSKTVNLSNSGQLYTGTFDVAVGTTQLVLMFNASSNARIDDVVLTATSAGETKTDTKVSFDENSGKTFTFTEGEYTNGTFTTPTATETTGVAGTIAYSSNNATAISVDASTGALTFNGYGKATITATFTPNETEKYAGSTDSYIVENNQKVDESVIIFSADAESFESIKGNVSYDTNKGNFDFVATNGKKYTFDVQRAIKDKGRLQLNSSTVTSPSFPDFTNGYKVSVEYTASSKSAEFTLSSGSKSVSGQGQCDKKILLLDVKDGAAFIIKTNNKAAYVSKIEIVPNKVGITLDENSESNTIEAKTGVNVTLKRTMVANEWNTICLPFNVSKEKAQTAFGEGVKIAELNAGSTGTTLSFNSVNEISATKPYLIKPSKENTSNEYVFENVNVVADDINKKYEITEGYLAFKGIYNMMDITKDVVDNVDATYYAAFLGAGNKIYKAGTGKTKGFRAYFAIPKSASASALRVVIDGTATSIKNIDSEVVESNAPVYNLQGQRVDGNNLTPGIYVKAGKKFVVK